MIKFLKKRMLKVLLAFAVGFCALSPLNVLAADVVITVYLDGKLVDFGVTNGKADYAQIVYDYAYAPIRKIIETLTGKTMGYDDATKTASFDFNGKNYSINVNSNGITVDGVFVPSATGTPPVNINSRILIPIKMITTVMGFSQVWNGDTRTVYLTSPLPVVSKPAVTAVLPDKTNIEKGETVTVTVKTNTAATRVKIENAVTVIQAQATSFRPEGSQNVFTLEIKPQKTERYYVYAGTASAFEITNPPSFSVNVNNTPLSIDSIIFSSSNVLKGQTVQLTIQTSTAAERIWLSNSVKGNFSQTTSGYTDLGGTRTWKINFTADIEGAVKYDVYASNILGAQVSRGFTLNVGGFAAEIRSVTARENPVNASTQTEITVITNTAVTSLHYSVQGGGYIYTPIQTSGYTDYYGERTWKNIFVPDSRPGAAFINIIAYTSTAGVQAVKDYTINVRADIAVKNVFFDNAVSAFAGGADVGLVVETGLGAEQVRFDYNGNVVYGSVIQTKADGKVWKVVFKTANVTQLGIVSAVSSYREVDSRTVNVPILVGL